MGSLWFPPPPVLPPWLPPVFPPLSPLVGWSGSSTLPSSVDVTRKHRELLRAIVAVRTGISFWKINLKVLDAAYSEAFPHSTPINVNKKKRKNGTNHTIKQ